MVEYCTLEDVRRALDIRTTQQDDWIASLIMQARDTIDRYVGYSFQDFPDDVRWFSGRGRDILITGYIRQIKQVIEVGYNPALGTFAAGERDITYDCMLWPEDEIPAFGIARVSGEPFREGRRNYRVVGHFGFSTVPETIRRACTRLVTHWVKMRDTAYSDTVSEQGSIRQKYTKEMPPDVIELLNLYRWKGFHA
ncbi:gp6-like head-tail connector protein [Thermosporothrix hazakensis]|jgi:hypothetical protein|uniref:Gp6-like head-tail connector protein n=1 Tax=Thermosporothrix hazakensis TaxID=644383 RepID=A0A326U6G4_THEHA|nr:phage head-tail connector protein [Thermosporothrix hazakensis]PZW28400.1 gp6-like head-tail connector protein [Thermosporothrix hazakensis]GCE45180.1 hypothetical protein KTH_00490 [Thermosporothrix hazakensis]